MKIFKCERLSTDEAVEKDCDGYVHPECIICTRNQNTQEQINAKKRARKSNGAPDQVSQA